MKYPVAEKFKAPQGEGVYTGTPMAFVRLVGCSVGKSICHACDTEFDRMRPDLGGGLYTPEEIVAWVGDYRHLCVTGGEPLDRDLRPLLLAATGASIGCHVETSGTRHPVWLDAARAPQPKEPGRHAISLDLPDGRVSWRWISLWVTVSPKPGYLSEMVDNIADEVKVINGGLGDGPGWPSVADAVRWATHSKAVVYVQPRNYTLGVDRDALREALMVVDTNPTLRLSVQLHKFISTR